jgi:hypothetical protein
MILRLEEMKEGAQREWWTQSFAR